MHTVYLIIDDYCSVCENGKKNYCYKRPETREVFYKKNIFFGEFINTEMSLDYCTYGFVKNEVNPIGLLILRNSGNMYVCVYFF